MRRSLIVLVTALVLSVAGAVGLTTTPGDSVAASGSRVPPVPYGAGQDLSASIASLQATLRRVPGDDVAWATLALAYVEQAGIGGLPSFYAKAETAIERSRSLRERDNGAALAADAALHAARHDFRASLDLSRRALRVNGRDAVALAVRVDALTELGRYDDQLRALSQADRLQPGVLVATRYAYAYELRGDLRRAAGILHRFATLGSRADRAHVLTLLADVQRRQGRLADASASLRLARRELPDHLPTAVSQARLDVARGRLERAALRWEGVVARLPLPEYVTELGELYQHLGRPSRAGDQYAVVDATLRLLARSGVGSDLEAALYDADHGVPARALTAARAEWGRRHSIHVADALAWALHRSGRSREALVYARRATALGTPEARLWAHRGAIEAALRMPAAARRDLRRALAVDPGFSPWQAARANALLERLEVRR